MKPNDKWPTGLATGHDPEHLRGLELPAHPEPEINPGAESVDEAKMKYVAYRLFQYMLNENPSANFDARELHGLRDNPALALFINSKLDNELLSLICDVCQLNDETHITSLIIQYLFGSLDRESFFQAMQPL